MSNRLAHSASPYLLQHQDNPVDWWEWGPDAFDEARRRNLPVFLSIGYSACHWCHVMAHESFEDPHIADFLNEHFVSIKVDREERPDIDAVYMDATIALTGSGGWPMSVFLDDAAQPFYAGTYFPPRPAHGTPSFPQLLEAIVEAWNVRRQEVTSAAARIRDSLASREVPVASDEVIDANDLQRAVDLLALQFDAHSAGFGGAPKFPPSMVLEFLLREAARTSDERALTMAEATLEAMARGGLYDQLAGGFARYSVDAGWVVPHFEKMLYDNALLLRVYAHWWRLTGSRLAERVVRETVEFLLDEMQTPEGGFAASLDADSEGVEGRYYVWSRSELMAALGPDDGTWAADLLSVTEQGTFEHGSSTLQLRAEPDDAQRWIGIRGRLHLLRGQRTSPGLDDKLVAAWNGMAISALAECGGIFDEPGWVEAAVRCAELLQRVHVVDGRLRRVSRAGVAGRAAGVLADYAALAEGFLVLAQTTGDEHWLHDARALLDTAVAHFRAPEGGYFSTGHDAERLVLRPRDVHDAAEPSGWAALGAALLTLSALTGDTDLRAQAEAALGPLVALGGSAPRAAGWALAAASASVDGPAEISIGDSTAELRRIAMLATAPGAVIRHVVGAQGATVCRFNVCSLPTMDRRELATQVGAHRAFEHR